MRDRHVRGLLRRLGSSSAALVWLVAACGGQSPPATPTAPAAATSQEAGGTIVPGTPATPDPALGSTAPLESPAEPTGDAPADGQQISATVDGQPIAFPVIALCRVTGEVVELSASSAVLGAGITVSWFANRPAAETQIGFVDMGSATAMIAGPEAPAATPPQVTVSGDSVQIVAELHDATGSGRPPIMIEIAATCGSSQAGGEPPAGIPDLPSGSGRAIVTIGGRAHEFTIGEQCVISDGAISVELSNAAGDALNVVVVGGASFMSLQLGTEQWTAGLSGAPMEFDVQGSRATWSGVAVEMSQSRQEPAMVELECGE